jgi:hypothetical protein
VLAKPAEAASLAQLTKRQAGRKPSMTRSRRCSVTLDMKQISSLLRIGGQARSRGHRERSAGKACR